MQLIDLIPDALTVNALPAEELAAVMLTQLNDTVKSDPQYRNAAMPKIHIVTYCSNQSEHYARNGGQRCAFAIATAWQHLVSTGMLSPHPDDAQHGWYFLTPRARAIKTQDDYNHYKKISLYPRGSIHPTIEAETYSEFLRGDYETAVFKAFKAVEIAVRPHSGADAYVVGRDLMAKAFNESGPLTDRNEVKAERDSLMELFRGAFGRFKNPTSHREIDLNDPAEAIETIQLASLLMRIVERRVDDINVFAAMPAVPEHPPE